MVVMQGCGATDISWVEAGMPPTPRRAQDSPCDRMAWPQMSAAQKARSWSSGDFSGVISFSLMTLFSVDTERLTPWLII